MKAIQQPHVDGKRLGRLLWSRGQINPGAENRSRPRFLIKKPHGRRGGAEKACFRKPIDQWATQDSNEPRFFRAKQQKPSQSVHICVQPPKYRHLSLHPGVLPRGTNCRSTFEAG